MHHSTEGEQSFPPKSRREYPLTRPMYLYIRNHLTWWTIHKHMWECCCLDGILKGLHDLYKGSRKAACFSSASSMLTDEHNPSIASYGNTQGTATHSYLILVCDIVDSRRTILFDPGLHCWGPAAVCRGGGRSPAWLKEHPDWTNAQSLRP